MICNIVGGPWGNIKNDISFIVAFDCFTPDQLSPVSLMDMYFITHKCKINCIASESPGKRGCVEVE